MMENDLTIKCQKREQSSKLNLTLFFIVLAQLHQRTEEFNPGF